ncbi:MAG: hypothetical protein CMM99_05785 [Rickettsiales bacterium]|nr:hypothetical protein [Rickettsiales bacterium]
MKIKCHHHKQQIKKLLFVDGIGRTGKMLTSKIVTSLKNFEQVEFSEFLEYTLAGMSLKKIKKDFAASFVNQIINQIAYNKMIGRNQNYRSTDLTSVKNFKKSQIYEKRAKSEEGSKVFKNLAKNKNYFIFMTHDVMTNFKFFNELNFDYKMIQIYRSPYDMIFSWYKRGLGHRYNNDPSSFDILLKYKNVLCPYYVAGYEKKWIKMNEVEKCAQIVLKLIKKSLKNHKNTKLYRKIYTTTYENIVQNSNIEIKKICKFLNTKSTSHTKRILKLESCPKIIDKKKQLQKKKFIISKLKKETAYKIYRMNKSFNKDVYGLIK